MIVFRRKSLHSGHKKCPLLGGHYIFLEKSTYILDSDIDLIKLHFSHCELKTIANSGHWVHAEQPEAFFNCVMAFINP